MESVIRNKYPRAINTRAKKIKTARSIVTIFFFIPEN